MSLASDHPVCVTCGAQYDTASFDPEHCKICEDARQYVSWNGQQWTSTAKLAAAGYRNRIGAEQPDVLAIGIEPSFGIGQRAPMVPGEGGNLLWDCVPYTISVRPCEWLVLL